MKVTLFELKEKMATLSAAIAADAEWIAAKAADPTIKMDEIEAKKAHRDELAARYNMLKEQHDEMEARQRDAAQTKAASGVPDEHAEYVKKKAAFYKAVLTGGDAKKAYSGLGAIPTGSSDLGSGENLLPVNMSNELITEPVEENSLRRIEPVSMITGLEEPKLIFSIDDEDLADVTDTDTAKEIELTGDTVTYGRYKTKIKATVKDTVLHGTDTNLVSAVENALRSGLAIKEKMRAFAPASGTGAYDTTHAHMSFYEQDSNGKTKIKTVEGSDIIDAITKAWADLPESFSANASVVMRKSDYYAAIRTLAGSGNDLWGKKPEDVLGIPVEFNDRAVIPVVGNFAYSRQNYENGVIYDTDKDVNKGEYYFVLTAWGDHVIRLRSAFRLAKVTANP